MFFQCFNQFQTNFRPHSLVYCNTIFVLVCTDVFSFFFLIICLIDLIGLIDHYHQMYEIIDLLSEVL